MALTFSQVMQLSAMAVMQSAGRRYRLQPINDLPNGSYFTSLFDPVTASYASISWSSNDEFWADTEAKKINLAKEMVLNAMRVLDDFIERNNGVEEDVQDVDFSL